MKIAVLSDVQANLPALEAVVAHILDWGPDLVVMNGDLVNRGPSSRACLEAFEDLRRSRGWLPIRGNHEDFVRQCRASPPRSAADAALRRFADFACEDLGETLALMDDWPDHLCFHAPEGADDWVHCTHGSLAGNRIGVSQSVPDEALAERVPLDVSLFVTAHTHKPLEREYRGVRLLNVGSVGSPFDGDPRASYGQIEHRGGLWHTRIARVDYDRGRTERDFRESGFLDRGGPLAALIHREWRDARMLMPFWRERYLEAVMRGDMDAGRAVTEFLGSLD